MTPNPGPTEANARLMEDLAARGLHATPAQFQRWRKAALLDSPMRRAAGRGKGRPSLRYPPAAVDQAAAIIRLLARRVPLNEMAMAMFLQGAPVSETAVRKALHSILVDPKSENLDGGAREDLADQRGDHMLRRARRIPLLQEWSKMSREAGNRGELDDPVTATVHAQEVATFPTGMAVEETAKMLGASADDVDDFFQYQIDLRPSVLREAIDTVTLLELRTAQTFVETIAAGILPPEPERNYQAFSIIVYGFAIFLRTANIDTDSTAILINPSLTES